MQGYPTIKVFAAGKKDGETSDYDGGRTGNDIVSWALDKVALNLPPPEIVQVFYKLMILIIIHTKYSNDLYYITVDVGDNHLLI